MLELSTIVNFRENELIDKQMELKNLALVVSTRIKNHVQSIKLERQKIMGKGKKEKDSREKYTKKLLEKSKLEDINLSGYNFQSVLDEQVPGEKAGTDAESEPANIEFKVIANFLVLMLYQIYRHLQFRNLRI